MPIPRLDSKATYTRSILIVFSLLWLVAAFKMPVLPDEAYYWTWSKDLSFHYFDHPPLVAWVLASSISIFGDHLLGLRMASLISIAISIGFTVSSTRLLLADQSPRLRQRADMLTVLTLFSAPMFVIGFLPMTPDSIQGAFTAVAVYSTLRALRSQLPGVWCGLAAFVFTTAIALKHYAVFIAMGAVIGLLRERDGRVRLTSRFSIMGLIMGLLLLSPWLFAEITQESSALWQFRRAIYGRPNRGLVAVPLMFGSLLGTFGPANAIITLLVLFRSHRFPSLRWASGSLLFACLVAVWAGSGEANWPISALVCLFPLVITFVLNRPKLYRTFCTVSVLCLVLNGFLLLHSAFVILDVPQLNDPTRRGEGFDEIAKQANDMARTHSASPIVTDRYQFASLLRYHLKDEVEVLEWPSPRARKSQFDLWNRPKVCPGQSIIWVSPVKKNPNWLFVDDFSPSKQRFIVDRAVERRKSLDRWYLTVGKLKSKALPMSNNCATENLQ